MQPHPYPMKPNRTGPDIYIELLLCMMGEINLYEGKERNQEIYVTAIARVVVYAIARWLIITLNIPAKKHGGAAA